MAGVGGVVQEAKVLPDVFAARAHVEAEKIRMEDAAVFELQRVLVAVRDVEAPERVGNHDF